MHEINGIKVPFIPAGGSQTLKTGSKNNVDGKFNKLFNEELNKLKFSSHATSRIKSRQIELNANDLSRLENAVSNARKKGAKDSLIFIDNNAFIVNVPNRTVITAIEKGGMNSNVITNIDSAVIG